VKRLGYRPELDGLRGVAILAVTAYHFGGFASAGFYGVDLFFVLSGFLITTLMIEEWQHAKDISLRRFYARRVRRLVPAVVMLLVALTPILVIRQGSDRAVTVIGEGALYAANVLHAFVHPDPLAASPLGHFWSLAEEEQFYLLWPPLLIVLLRKGTRRIGWMLLLAAAALAVDRFGLHVSGASFQRLYFAPDTHAGGIVLGCGIAFFREQWRPSGKLASASLITFLWLIMFTGKSSFATYGLSLVEVASAVLVLYAAQVDNRFLAARPLVATGAISYGLYVYQGAAMWLLRFGHHQVVALSLTVAVACLSYRCVEKPVRQWHRRMEMDRQAPSQLSPLETFGS
jgi:peptidoglycan/LPS O-acetylase OafA/YrhL